VRHNSSAKGIIQTKGKVAPRVCVTSAGKERRRRRRRRRRRERMEMIERRKQHAVLQMVNTYVVLSNQKFEELRLLGNYAVWLL
jgi:hypothetical protein